MRKTTQQPAAAPDPSLRRFLKMSLCAAAMLPVRSALADPQYQSLNTPPGSSGADAAWVRQAIAALWRDREMAGVTPLVKLAVPSAPGISIFLKDESKSPTGSLKHRVAWGLLMDALVNGKIGPNTKLYEASSGNTAIGEAYFSQMLGLSFTAVMRPGVSEGKLRAIRGFGGKTEIVDAGSTPSAFIDKALADDPLAYNINQFANTEKSLDYFRGPASDSMNMANEIFGQLQNSGACPAWFVAGAGSGGTATSIARYIRKWADKGLSCGASMAVVDPEDSALFAWYQTGDESVTVPKGSRIEGIGSRGPVRFGSTFSLLRGGVSRMIKVPDADSVAAMHFVSELVGHSVGPSTGTNFCGALHLADEMRQRGETGSIVTIICDDGNRYRDNYYNSAWIHDAGLDYEARLKRIQTFWNTGTWS